MKKADTPRLLLVEFVSTSPERNESASFFPFYAGLARSGGSRTRWVCVGKRAGAGPALSREEIAGLARSVSGYAPTHIIANEGCDGKLEPLIRKRAPAAKLLFTDDDSRGASRENPGGYYRTGWLSEWLGLPAGPDRFFVGPVTPLYEAVMLNRRARETRPLLTVPGGVSCDYAAAISRNPYFRGVDLSRCVRRHGCSFCSSVGPPASSMKADPLRLARDQFLAMLRTGDTAGGRVCGRFDIRDIRLFKRISDFAKMILKLDLPPSEFFFAPRLDDLLGVGADLEALLPGLAARGHRVHLFRIGLEHFSPSENERFNKGLPPETIDKGLVFAQHLERIHPDTFGFEAPLGHIAFTPWTTLEDLELSLKCGIRRGFSPQAPWLYATLELEEGTPITALARHEGDILQERFDDAAMTFSVQADNRGRPGLLPWRFRDPRTAAACGIIVRVCAASLRGILPEDHFKDDPLSAWLTGFLAEEGLDTGRPDLFALELVAILKSAPSPWEPKTLIRAAFSRLKTEPSARLRAAVPQASAQALKLDLDLAVAELLGHDSRTKEILSAPPAALGLDAVAGILRSLAGDRPDPSDPLTRCVGTFIRKTSAAGFDRSYAAHLALSAHQQAAWSGRRVLPAEVIARAVRMIPRPKPEGRARPVTRTFTDVARSLDRNPVVTVDNVHPDHLKAWLSTKRLPNVRSRPMEPNASGRSAPRELFFGRDLRDVECAVKLATRLQNPSLLTKDATRAAVELGLLFGIPECCSQASVEKKLPFRDVFFWNTVAARIAAPREVPWEMNPDNPALQHLPCSLGCVPTLRGLKEDLRARQKKALASGRDIVESLKQPFLLIWGFDKAMVELIPEEEPSERFKYHAESSSPPCPDIASVLQGDELFLDEDKVVILKKGRIFSSLSGRSFLWWHKRSFQTDFWRSLIERRQALADPRAKAVERSARALNEFFSSLDSEFRKKHRIPCRSRHDGRLLLVTLEKKTWPLFLIPKTSPCEAYYQTTPNYYVGIRGEVPMSALEQSRLRAYLSALGRRDKTLMSCLP